MEYIIIGLLILIIVLQILLLTKKNNNSDIYEKLTRNEINVIKEISDFKHEFSSSLNNDFNTLNDRIERKLNLINQKVNEKLEDGFDKTNRTFTEVMNRLTRIDDALRQKGCMDGDLVAIHDFEFVFEE